MFDSIYWKLTKFLLPLVLTSTLQDVGEQFLKRSLASSSNAVLELASFAIAYKIFSLFNGIADECKYLSMVLLKTSKDRRNLLIFVGLFMCIPMVLMILLGVSPLGYYFIEVFHDVSGEVADKSRVVLLIFSFYPIFDGIAYVHFGVLIRYKYSFICGLAFISNIIGQIITVIIALNVKSSLGVIYVPLIASYVGLLARFTITMVAYYKYVHHRVCEATTDEENEQESSGVGFLTILKTYLPLLVARTIQKISRPLLNLFVARDREGGHTEQDSIEALATLSIVYPVGHVCYGFINETKSIEATFTKKDDSGRSEATVRQVRWFIFMCFCVSFCLNIIFFWIPGVTVPVVMAVADVKREFAEKCVVPLRIMSFHCIPVSFRDATVGWLLKVKRTSAIYPSVVCRIILIIVFANVAPILGFHGAPMATTILFSGFCTETTVILVSAAYVKWSRKRALREREAVSLVAVEDSKEQDLDNNDDRIENSDKESSLTKKC